MNKRFCIIIFIFAVIISFFSCAAPHDLDKRCESDKDCEIGYYCFSENHKCEKRGVSTGNLNENCNKDNTCNYSYLECNSEKICIIKVDSEKQCHPNDRSSCYTGDFKTLGKGICKPGYYLCSGDFKWDTTCINEVVPVNEICNNGIDDDCDGLIDENCDSDTFCIPYSKRSCYTANEITKNIGVCESGYQLCNENNKWNDSCNNQIVPINEICDNGFDDNCNGKIDENCQCTDGKRQSCFSGAPSEKGIGECKAGIQLCSNGIWGECQGEILPVAETCDGKDNNCNGIIDDGVILLNNECKEDIPELCNGIDDNQNGIIDENCSKKCLDFEVCGNFKDDNCDNQIDENCYDKPLCIAKDEEICGNIFDDNCNLFISENCSCGNKVQSDCYSGPEETLGVGECKKGEMVCIAGEAWGECEGEITPVPELCNGKDDDCDSLIDENFHVAEPCFVGFGICQKEGVWVCDKNSEGVICIDPLTTQEIKEDTSLATEELCDGVDNDCDGYIDEDFLVNKLCVNGYSLCQNIGTTKCLEDGSDVICDSEPNLSNAIDEICNNGIDDDCDGLIDEETGEEYCGDGKDNNCNGLIDEQPCISGGPVVTCPMLSEVYKDGENKIYTLQEYTFTAQAYDPTGDSLIYKWELISAPEGNGQYPIPDNQLTTKFTPYLVSNMMNHETQSYTLRFTATEANTTEHLSEHCDVVFNVVTKDVFHVELIWTTLSDMDLHLVVPGGDEYSFVPRDNNGIDCNYASCRGPAGLEWNTSDNLDNPYLDLDNTVGFGCPGNDNLECNRPENINVPSPRNRIGDVYRVGVYAFEGTGENLKLKILCKSQVEDEFIVKEYYKDRLRSTSTSTNRWWKPANILWHGNYCTIEDN